MGLRGPGAVALKRQKTAESPIDLRQPWDAPGLSPAEHVILFCESLPVTLGKLAGTKCQAKRGRGG